MSTVDSRCDPISGYAGADRYIATGYDTVVGMSSRFAAAVCAKLMRIQAELGVQGHFAEIGAFEGRFLIAMAHCLEPGEKALGMDVFTWPNPQVKDRFEANCAKHGVPGDRRIAWTVDSNKTTPDEVRAKLGSGSVRLFHIDGEHTRAALSKDLELAAAVLDPGGLIVLDDMLHPGYPTLVLAVEQFLERHPEMTVLCIIDRETITAATKFVLCRADWFKRYESEMLAPFKPWTWPMGASFEPHWCLVLSRDTSLAAIE